MVPVLAWIVGASLGLDCVSKDTERIEPREDADRPDSHPGDQREKEDARRSEQAAIAIEEAAVCDDPTSDG